MTTTTIDLSTLTRRQLDALNRALTVATSEAHSACTDYGDPRPEDEAHRVYLAEVVEIVARSQKGGRAASNPPPKYGDTLRHGGRLYHFTGKAGTTLDAFEESSWEYADDRDARVWVTETRRILED